MRNKTIKQIRKRVEKLLCNTKTDNTTLSKELYELVFNFQLNETVPISVETFNFVKGALITLINNIEKCSRLELLDIFNSLWKEQRRSKK